MKIWVDVLTPKQVLFYEPLIKKLKKKGHRVFVTSRKYREASDLIRLRKLNYVLVGKHGGGSLAGKMDASINRTKKLIPFIEKFKPDLLISQTSPDAIRLAFAYGIKIYAFSNTPHSEKVMKLALPMVDKLFIPKHIDKKYFTKYGIDADRIIQYNAMDEIVWIKNKPLKLNPIPVRKKMILIRTVEAQASYYTKNIDLQLLCKTLTKEIPTHEVAILPRYSEEIPYLKKLIQKKGYGYVFDEVVDSTAILNLCDVFIGSGGTMTTEAVLRGVPTVSMNLAPNLDEVFLHSLNLLTRAEKIKDIVKDVRYNIYLKDRALYRKNVSAFKRNMENPHNVFIKKLSRRQS